MKNWMRHGWISIVGRTKFWATTPSSQVSAIICLILKTLLPFKTLLLFRNEKIVALLNLLILCATVTYLCYNSLHWTLWTIFLVLVFFGCMLVNCIIVGQILLRMQEHRILAGQSDQFHEYVERLNQNPMIHEKFSNNAQTRIFGVRLPSVFQRNQPTYV